MFTHTLYTYATPDASPPLDCDVYTYEDECNPTDVPVVLFFHGGGGGRGGGLVNGSRACVPPWLVQACYRRRWPLISPSYRLLPQVGAQGLLQDALAAYSFAQTYGASVTGKKRRVVAAGASAGFFLASLIASHIDESQKPVVLLSISGIPTFRHPFFYSQSVLEGQAHIQDDEVAVFPSAPTMVGSVPTHDPMVFSPDQLVAVSGERNPEFVRPAKAVRTASPDPFAAPFIDLSARPGLYKYLYEYYLQRNAFPDFVGSIDPGFQWAPSAADNSGTGVSSKWESWPKTFFIHGGADTDIAEETAQFLGPEKAEMFVAPEQGHLFEGTAYLDDEDPGMDAVREAIGALDAYVGRLE